jgi:hypothetical protein
MYVAFLGEMNRYVAIVVSSPLELGTKEVVDIAHEVNLESSAKSLLECQFYIGVR